MKKNLKFTTIFVLTITLLLSASIPAFAHSGRTDANGGHNKTSDGTYHYHDGSDRTIEYSAPPNRTAPTLTPVVTPIPASAPTPTSVQTQEVAATSTTATVYVDGVQVDFDAYGIGGNNYFKLRDLAYSLNGSSKQFEVGFDANNNAISLTSNSAYTIIGGEMAKGGADNKTATQTTSKTLLDGKEVQFTAYNIGGNNYFMLRDLGQAINFGVDWDGTKNAIFIDTSKGYGADASVNTPAQEPPQSSSISLEDFLLALKNTDMNVLFGFEANQEVRHLLHITTEEGPFYTDIYRLNSGAYPNIIFELYEDNKMSGCMILDLKDIGFAFNAGPVDKIYDILGRPDEYEEISEMDGDIFSYYTFAGSFLTVKINEDRTVGYLVYSLKG